MTNTNTMQRIQTGWFDREKKPIYAGDHVKLDVDEAFKDNNVHGNYTVHQVIFRNNVWMHEYLYSETGYVLPKGYIVGELQDRITDYNMDWRFNESESATILDQLVIVARKLPNDEE